MQLDTDRARALLLTDSYMGLHSLHLLYISLKYIFFQQNFQFKLCHPMSSLAYLIQQIIFA